LGSIEGSFSPFIECCLPVTFYFIPIGNLGELELKFPGFTENDF